MERVVADLEHHFGVGGQRGRGGVGTDGEAEGLETRVVALEVELTLEFHQRPRGARRGGATGVDEVNLAHTGTRRAAQTQHKHPARDR